MPPIPAREANPDLRRLSVDEAMLSEEEGRLLRRVEQLRRRTASTAGIARGLGVSGLAMGVAGLPPVPTVEGVLAVARLRDAVLRSRKAAVEALALEVERCESALESARSALARSNRGGFLSASSGNEGNAGFGGAL